MRVASVHLLITCFFIFYPEAEAIKVEGQRAMRIYYFIPEDGDDVSHPNAFSIPDATPTVDKIKQVHSNIPL